MVVRGIKVHEVREEAAGRHLACKFVQVIVAVLWKVADSALLFPDLDREDCSRAVSYAFVCGVEDLADHASSLGGGVCTIIY